MSAKKTTDELEFLEELGLPLSATQRGAKQLEEVLAKVRTCGTNRSKKALFVTHKDGNRPIEIQGREQTIDFFKADCAKGSLSGLGKKIKAQGYFVTTYAGGLLVRLHKDER